MVSRVSVLETHGAIIINGLSLPFDLGCHEDLGGLLHNEAEKAS